METTRSHPTVRWEKLGTSVRLVKKAQHSKRRFVDVAINRSFAAPIFSKPSNMSILRAPVEQQFAHELDELRQHDTQQRPPNWVLSPQAVVLYLMGGRLPNGFEVSAKYIGQRRLIEIAVATLTTDRALLLYGLPGTAKSWVSEHLSAAISGSSTLLVQGTAGTSEEAIRYGWNYARLLAEGPSEAAIVPTPVLHAMREGRVCRIEELTRIGADVQDSLITILSEKVLPIPELSTQVQAVEGFNIIATANNRDKGVNELSSALKRRFNTVILPVPESANEEIEIVRQRVASQSSHLTAPKAPPLLPEIQRVVTIFRELRAGVTADGRTKIKSPTGTMSTAEAIAVVSSGLALATHFGDGQLHAHDLAAGLLGAVVKDPVQDKIVWNEYLESVVKPRDEWKDLYRACKELM
jgi:MoxR-like ATPase